jgi:hypothetical protein
VHLDGHRWTVKSPSAQDGTQWPPQVGYIGDRDERTAAHYSNQYDRLHARGYLSLDIDKAEHSPAPLDLAEIRARCHPMIIDGMPFVSVIKRKSAQGLVDFYKGMRYFAEYGPEYRRITSIIRSSDRKEALVEVRGLQEDLAR